MWTGLHAGQAGGVQRVGGTVNVRSVLDLAGGTLALDGTRGRGR